MSIPENITVRGHQELMNTLKQYEQANSARPIYIYFFGEKDKKGVSWCSDCVLAEPILKHAFEHYADKNALIVSVDVGSREYWKDELHNEFRKPPFSVTSIPTLVRWKGVERLDGDYINKDELVKMFFDEINSQSATSLPATAAATAPK